jgi:ribosome-associated protein
MRDLDLGNGIIVPAEMLRAVASRSSGPGGQHVNKTETRVTIELPIDALPLPDEQKSRIHQRLATRINREGILRVTSQAERSQIANRDHALERMEELLRDALKERKKRGRTKIPKVEKRKRLEEKKKRGEKKRLRGKVED